MIYDNKLNNSTTLNNIKLFQVRKLNEYLQIIVLVFVFVTNIFLIVGIVKTNERLSRVKRLFVYLSCIDMMYIPSTIISFVVLQEQKLDCWSIALTSMFDVFIRTNGILTFMAISVLRSHSIVKPLIPISQKAFAQILAGKLSISLVFSGITMFQIPCMTQVIDFPYFYFITPLFITFVNFITLASNLVSDRYLRISEGIEAETWSKRKHSMRTLLIMTVVYLITCTPLVISTYTIDYFRFTKRIDRNEDKFYLKLGGVASAIGFSNNALNALIYTLRNKKIRNYYTKKICWSTVTITRTTDITMDIK